MTDQVYSREYLQSLPEVRKREHIERLLTNFINEIVGAASYGKTSCMYDPLSQSALDHQCNNPIITTEDIISVLKTRFPECDVSYQEIWVETTSTRRKLKKGIVVDWS